MLVHAPVGCIVLGCPSTTVCPRTCPLRLCLRYLDSSGPYVWREGGFVTSEVCLGCGTRPSGQHRTACRVCMKLLVCCPWPSRATRPSELFHALHGMRHSCLEASVQRASSIRRSRLLSCQVA